MEPATLLLAGLAGVSLAPVPGALTVILGRPGSGKSALLRAVAGLERPRGTVRLDGTEIGRMPPHRRLFGVVLQPDTLFPRLTLAENVAFPLRMRGMPASRRGRLVEEALDAVGLHGLAAARPDRTGPAERQRAMLARAIVGAPRLLLLDEPFSHQDSGGRTALQAALRRVQMLLGCTTLLATADAAGALAVADRIAVLHRGAIEQHGTPEEVHDQPGSLHAAALLGEINQLSGTVAATDDDLAAIRLACGPVVHARKGPGLNAGDTCILTVRPARVALAGARAADLGEGALDARVIETRFLGDSTRLRVLIGSGSELVVRRPAAAGIGGIRPGDGVAVAWQDSHAWAFRL